MSVKRFVYLTLGFVLAIFRLMRRKASASSRKFMVFGATLIAAVVMISSNQITPAAAAGTIRSGNGNDVCTAEVGNTSYAWIEKSGNWCNVWVTTGTTVKIPSNVNSIGLLVVGGGAGGFHDGGSGGSGGEVRFSSAQTVTPGATATIAIGAAGAAGPYGGTPGTGGQSSVTGAGFTYRANGGNIGGGWGNATGPSGGSGGEGGTGYVGGAGGGGPGGVCDPLRWGGFGGAITGFTFGGISNLRVSGGGGGGTGAQTYNNNSYYGIGAYGGVGGGGGGANLRYALDDTTWIDGASAGHNAFYYGGGGGGGSACDAYSASSGNGTKQRTPGGSGYQGVVIMSWQENKLAFSQVPDGCLSNVAEACLQSAKVQLQDFNGTNLNTLGLNVTIVSASSGTLNGTLTASTDGSGVATFNNFWISGLSVGNTSTLTFEIPGWRNIQTTVTLKAYAETLTVVTGSTDTNGAFFGTTGKWLATASASNISTTTLANELASRDVTLRAASPTASSGNIAWSSFAQLTESASTARQLTFISSGNFYLNSGGRITSSGQPLNVLINSNYDNASGGLVGIDGATGAYAIETNGGWVYIGGGSATTTWNSVSVPSGYSEGYAAANGSWWGIQFGVNQDRANALVIKTGGGEFKASGKATASTDVSSLYGIAWEGGKIDTGTGAFTMVGTTSGSPSVATNENFGIGIGANHGSANDVPVLATTNVTAYFSGDYGTLGTSNAQGVNVAYADFDTGTANVYLYGAKNVNFGAGNTFRSPVLTTPTGAVTVSAATTFAAATSLTAGTSFTTSAGITTTGAALNITANGGNVTLGGSISQTSTSNPVNILATANILGNTGASITTAGGAVNIFSDTDGTSGGNIQLGSTASITTNGGDVTLAGGNTSGTGYARGTATATVAGNSGFVSQADIQSGGGDVTIRGAAGTATVDSAAVYLSSDASIVAAGGNITLDGVIGNDQTQTTSPVRAVRLGGGGTAPYVQVTTTGSGTITITGDNTLSAYANRGAILLEFATLTSDLGAIKLTAKTATNNSAGLQFVTGLSTISSTSGAITLEDTAGTAISSDLSYLKASTAGTISLRLNNPTFATTTDLSGTGKLLVVPVSANFTSAPFTFPGVAATIGTTFSQLDIGRVATTSNITLSGANISVAGPVNIYGTDIIQTSRLTTTGSTSNTINYAPKGSFTNTATTGLITSAGGLSITSPAAININAAIAAKGAIWLESTGASSDITVKGNIITSVAGSNLTLKSKNHIFVPDASTIQTAGASSGAGGNIIFWSDSDTTGEGAIKIDSDSTVNSIGGSTSATTGGGQIVMAGGADTGATTVKSGRTSGDNIPDGYAVTTSTARSGIDLSTDVLAASVLKINSGGGKVEMFGKSDSGIEGFIIRGPVQINSGEGQIVIDGLANAYHGVQIYNEATPTALNIITSSSGVSPAIDIRGVYTGGGTGYNYGILSGLGAGAMDQIIQATGAGGINLYGRSNGGHRDIGINATAVLSASGKILVDAGGTTGIITNQIKNQSLSASYNYFGRCPILDCPGSLVTTSTADIEMITNSITTFTVTDVKTRIYTSGEVDIHNPVGTTAFVDLGGKFSGLDFATSVSKLTIGRAGDTTNIDVNRDWTIDGPISLYGSDLDLMSNIVSTKAGSPIRIESTTIIVQYNGKKIQTAGGSGAEIILWANKLGTGGSYYADAGACINTVGTCTPNATQIKSGGAAVYIAGGNNTGTYPTGYAVNDGRNEVGVRLGVGGNSGFKIYTGGGDLTIRGKGKFGVYSPGGETVNSGDGKIVMNGYAESEDEGIRLGNSATAATTTYTSSKDGGNAIEMTGTSTGTTGYTSGIMFFDNAVTNIVEATGTGGISMVGRTPNKSHGRGLWFNSVNIYSTSGNILLDAGPSKFDVNQEVNGGVTIGSRATGASASGNVTIYANHIEHRQGVFNIRTTGDVVAEPSGATWTYSDIVWGATLVGVDDFRLGKDNGTSAQGQPVWIYAEQVSAGNMEFYGNNIYFQYGGAKTTGSGKYMSIMSTGLINLYAGMALQTNGGQLAIWADKDNNGSGYVMLNNTTCVNSQNSCVTPANTGGANIYIGGGASSGTTPAYPTGAAQVQSDNYGIWLGTSGAAANNVKIYSGGGDISMKANNPGLAQHSIRSYGGLQVNSGVGSIDIRGTSSGTPAGAGIYGIWFASINYESALRSAKPAGTAINLDFTSTNTGDYATPILLWEGSDSVRNTIAATGGGNIVMNGTASGSSANTYSYDINNADIFVKGAGSISMTGNRGFWFNRYTAGQVNIGASSSETTSGAITLSGGRLAPYSTLPVNFKTTGDVTLQPMTGVSSFLEGVSFPSGQSTFTGVNNLTIGKDGNNQNINLNATTGMKSLNVYGQDLTLAGDVNVSMATKTSDGFMAKALGHIEQSANVDITTAGGRATLWARSGVADSATTTYGKIWLKDSTTITTNGGDIRLAGSSNQTDGYPTGHALSNTTGASGVRLGETLTLANSVKLLSAGATGTAGGNIVINGQSTSSSSWGVGSYGGVQVSSGLGRISIDGIAAGGDDGVQFMHTSAPPTITSAAVDDAIPAIKISGTSSGALSGIQIAHAGVTISATGAGDIEINGTATGTGYGLDIVGAKILAPSGSITLNGGAKGSTFNSTGTTAIEIGDTAATPTSTSDINIIGDVLALSTTYLTKLATKGNVVIESSGAKFTTFTIAGFSVNSLASSVRIGKTTDTESAITTASTATIAANGPVSIYGGTLTIGGPVTANSSGSILLKAGVDVLVSNNLTTSGGTVTLWSDSDNTNQGGILVASASTISTSGGAVSLGGGNGAAALDGYAKATDAITSVSNTVGRSGIRFLGDITSGAGNITMRGADSTTNIGGNSHNAGIEIEKTASFLTTSGDVTFDGYVPAAAASSSGNHIGMLIGWGPTSNTASTTITTTDGDINLKGSSVDRNIANSSGLWMVSLAVSSTSGKIVAEGYSGSLSNGSLKSLGSTFISPDGAISATTDSNGAAAIFNGSTSWSSNVSVTMSVYNPSVTSLALNGSGDKVFESSTDSSGFSGPINNVFTVASTSKSLRIGKSTNNVNVTIDSAISIAGPITVYGAALSTTAAVTSTGDAITYSGSTFNNAAALTTTNKDITISADQVTLGAALTTTNTTGGIVTIAPKSVGKNIDLGANDSATLLGLTDAELDRVTAKVLRIGSLSYAGNVNVSAPITLASNLVPSLAIRGAGNVTQTGTGSIAVANLGINAGGTITFGGGNVLTGNLALAATGGAVSFNQSSGSYTPATVDTIPAKFGTGYNLAVTAVPAVNVSTSDQFMAIAFDPPPVATITDEYGNALDSKNTLHNDYTVTATLAPSTTGTGALAGDTAVATANGVATFNNLKVTGSPGSYDLSFAATLTSGSTAISGASTASSGTYVVAAGDPDHLVISRAAGGTMASGKAFSIQPIIRIEDVGNNLVQLDPGASAVVTATLTSGTGTLVGTQTATASGGIATFTNLGIAGSTSQSFTITYSITTPVSLTKAQASISVTHGDAAKLVATTEASGAVNRLAFEVQPTVKIYDAYDNLVNTGASAGATISVAASAGATLATNLTATANAGSATFSGLKLSGAAGDYTLTYSSGSLATDDQALVLTHGAATQLEITRSASGFASDSAFTVQPKITIQDADGNTVKTGVASTQNVVVSVSSGTFSGIKSVPAIAGVADFVDSGLSLKGAVGGYTLTYKITSPVEITKTQGITLDFGIATKLAITTQAANFVNREAFSANPKVTVQDSFGNTVTSSTATIEIALSGATLSSTASVDAVGGVATFSGLSKYGQVGSKTLTFTSTGLAPASQTFELTHGAAYQLEKTIPAAGFTNNVAFGTQPKITIQDRDGNPVITGAEAAQDVTVSASGSAAFAGTKVVRSSAGIADFDGKGLKLTGAATSYTLTFKIALPSEISTTQGITLAVGAATKLYVSRPAATAVNRTAFDVQPIIEVHDISDNLVTTSTATITVTANTATVTGLHTQMDAVGGIADFTDEALGLQGTAGLITLSFESTNLTSAPQNIQLTHGVAYQLAMTTPTSVANDTVFGTQPVVTIQDQDGNTVDTGLDSRQSVSLSSADATLGGTGLLSSTVSMNAVAGIANFDGTNISLTATRGVRHLKASISSPTAIETTNSITITFGAAYKLAVTTRPTGAVNGVEFTGQPVIEVQDISSNPVTNSTASITVTTSAGADLGGTKTIAASGGSATFSNLKLTGTAATNYTLSFTSGNLAGTSDTIYLVHGAATKLEVTTLATGFANRADFSINPVVTVQDAWGNTVTDSSASVEISISDATLTGTNTTITALNGVAAFSGLGKYGTIGTKVLTFKSAGLADATQSFELTHGVATHLELYAAANAAKAGIAFGGQPTVRILDADDNLVDTGANAEATIEVTTSAANYNAAQHSGADLVGTTSIDASAGLATFAGLKFEGVAGSYGLSFAATAPAGITGFTPVTQNITVTAGTETSIRVVEGPTNIVAGEAFNPAVKVEFLDAYNNRVLDVASSATIEPELIEAGLLPSVIDSSKTAVAPSNGLVTFTGLTFTKVGTHKVRFTASGLSAISSSDIVITNAAPHHLAWITEPTGAKNDVALSPAPVLEVQDEFDNPAVVGAATTVTAAVQPANSDVLQITGTSATSDSNARVTFSNLVLRAKVGSYGLRFTAANSGLVIDGFVKDTTNPVAITYGDPTKLAVTSPASGSNAGAAFSSQPIVTIQDSASNTVANSGLTVTASMSNRQLLGVTTKDATAGVANFDGNGLGIEGVAANGLTLKYAITIAGNEIFTTQPINLNAGSAVAITVGQQPGTVKNRDAFAADLTVLLRDAWGNHASADSSSTVTAQLFDSNGNSVSAETAAVAAASGAVTFSGLAFNAAPATGYQVKFKLVSNAALVTSTPFTINPGDATQLVIVRSPASVEADSTTTKTGNVLPTQPIVKLLDQDNYLVTTANTGAATIRIKSGAGGNLTEGVTTANFVGGIANFAGVVLVGTPGVSYTFDFASASPNPVLTSGASSAVSVIHNDATHLVVTQQASGGRSGDAFAVQPKVAIKDRYENTVTSGPSANLTIRANAAITAPTAGAADVNGGSQRPASFGEATFVSLGITGRDTNTYKLTFSISNSSIAAATQTGITIGYGYSSRVVLTVPPAGGNATGSPLATQPVLEVQDASGNKVQDSNDVVIVSIASAAGATLADGSAARVAGHTVAGFPGIGIAAVNGVATFSQLTLFGLPNTGYQLNFSIGLTDATAAAIQVTHAAAHHLTVTSSPTGGNSSGANLAGQPVVELRDVYENVVTSNSTDSVAARILKSGPAGAPAINNSLEFIRGNTTKTFVAGVANFAGLQVVALPAGQYQLDFASTIGATVIGSAVAPTASFSVTYATASKLAVHQQPLGGNATGTDLTTQPIIEVQDEFGNRVDNYVGSVTASATGATVTNSANPGVLTATVSGGLATFSHLALTGTPATDYQLTFDSTPLTSINSGSIRVVPGAPVRILMSAQPEGAQNGAALATQPVVRIVDSFGNTVTQDSSTVITARISAGTRGNLTHVVSSNSVAIEATVANGVATFSNLYMRGLSTVDYKLSFESGNLVAAESDAFRVTHAAVSALVWRTQPQVGPLAERFNVAPVLELQDLDGNLAISDSATDITATVSSGTGGTLTNATVRAVGGVVTFTNLTFNGTPGATYRLTFSGTAGATSVTSAASDAFVPTHAAPAELAMRGAAVTGGLTGQLLTSQPALEVRDRFHNLASTDNETIVVASILNDTTGSVDGQVRITAVNGLVDFTGLTVAGHPGTGYRLVFNAVWRGTDLTAVNSNAFTVSKVADASLSYTPTGGERNAVDYSPNLVLHPTFSTDSLGSAVSYTTDSLDTICVLDTTTGDVTVKGVGTCSVRVDVGPDTYYQANYAEADLVISKARQEPVIITSAASVNYLSTLQPAASGGSGTGAITYTATGSCRLIVGTNTIIPGDAGSACVLTAKRLGDANYLDESSAPMTITVNKIAQNQLAMASSNSLLVGSIPLLATGGSGTGALTYQVVSAGNTRCSIAGNVLTAAANGICEIRAVKAASTNYLVTDVTQTITVLKQEQNVAFGSTVPMYPDVNGSYIPTATATSGGSVVFTLSTNSTTPACAFDNVNPAKINFLAAGLCEVVATQAGSDSYATASATQSIRVSVLNQSIAFTAIEDRVFGSPAFFVDAKSNSGLEVAFAVSGTSVACSVSATGKVVITAVGLCEIEATQAGNTRYAPASPVLRSFMVTADLAGSPYIYSVSSASQSITATFTAPSYTGGLPIIGYELIATDTLGNVFKNSACGVANTPLSCTVIDLQNREPYTAKVVAITAAGRGNFSNTSEPQTPLDAPYAVNSLSATASNTDDLVVKWTVPAVNAARDNVFASEFDRYEVQVIPAGTEFTDSTPASAIVTDPTATTATVNNLSSITAASLRTARFNSAAAGQLTLRRASVVQPVATSPALGYKIRVVTFTDGVQRPITTNTTNGVQLGFGVPEAPARVLLRPVASKLWITWSAPTADGGSPVIDYTVKVNDLDECTVAANAAYECQFGSLVAGKTYAVQIIARNLYGLSSASLASHAVPAPPAPPAPAPTSASPSPSVSPSPSASPSASASPKPTPKPSVKPTVKPSASPTAKPSATATPKPGASASATPKPTSSSTPTPGPLPTDNNAGPSEPEVPIVPVIPEINPGEPVANPGIGASGDDNAPSVPFDPLASEEGIKALTETTGKIAAVAASVAAAAAAAAAGAAAAGAAGAAGSAGSSGGGSSSGDAGSIANIDAAHEEYRLRRRGRGDRWKLWNRKFMTFLDKPSVALTVATGKVSPLLTRILEDGAYLRAAFGSFAMLPSIAAVAIAIISLVTNGDNLQPPIWQLFLAIAVIGIFDTFAGALGTSIFVVGSLLVHGFSDLNDIRMLLGVIIVGYGPALLANSFRAFRKVPAKGDVYWWERLVDLGVLPFIAGWTTSAMISTLPALAGVTLPVANHVTDFSLAIAAAVMVRVIAEEASARIFPRRLDYLHPSIVADTHPSQRWVSLVIRLAVFIFVTAALMGNDWRVWLGSALFVLPNLIGFYSDKFKNFPLLWRIMPNGIPGLALTLLVANATTTVVGSLLGNTPDLVLWSFALLPIPMLALSLLHMFGREGNPGEERWIRTPKAKWVYRIGGVIMLLITLKIAGVI